MKEAQSLGLKVVVWTVNEPADMRRMIEWGVDGIISDRPDLLRRVAGEMGVALPSADAGYTVGRGRASERATISPESRSTGGASMVKLEFHDPSGALEVTQPHAPRLASLEGKRIGFVSNEQWQAYRMLPMLKEMLEQDFPGVEVLPIDAYPAGQRPDRHRGDRGGW